MATSTDVSNEIAKLPCQDLMTNAIVNETEFKQMCDDGQVREMNEKLLVKLENFRQVRTCIRNFLHEMKTSTVEQHDEDICWAIVVQLERESNKLEAIRNMTCHAMDTPSTFHPLMILIIITIVIVLLAVWRRP